MRSPASCGIDGRWIGSPAAMSQSRPESLPDEVVVRLNDRHEESAEQSGTEATSGRTGLRPPGARRGCIGGERRPTPASSTASCWRWPRACRVAALDVRLGALRSSSMATADRGASRLDGQPDRDGSARGIPAGWRHGPDAERPQIVRGRRSWITRTSCRPLVGSPINRECEPQSPRQHEPASPARCTDQSLLPRHHSSARRPGPPSRSPSLDRSQGRAPAAPGQRPPGAGPRSSPPPRRRLRRLSPRRPHRPPAGMPGIPLAWLFSLEPLGRRAARSRRPQRNDGRPVMVRYRGPLASQEQPMEVVRTRYVDHPSSLLLVRGQRCKGDA